MVQKKTEDYAAMKAELDEILTELQDGDLAVDEAIKQYEKGLGLVEHLEAHLKTAENTIKKLQPKPGKE